MNVQAPATTPSSTPLQPKSKSAMAIAGFVLGCVALLTSFIPIVNNLSFVLALLGLIFTIVGLVGVVKGKKSGKGLAIAALAICVVSGAVVLATQSAYSVALDAANPSSTVSSSAQPAEDTSASSDFSVSDEQLNKDTYSTTVTGTLTNNTGKDLSYVGVTYAFYDKNGNLIDNAYANATSLKAGASWKFEAYVVTADADAIASYECTDVQSW